jgi:hypothetical protein
MDVGVHDEPMLLFAITDDDNPEFGSEGGEVALVTPGDGNVEEGHGGKQREDSA